MISRSTSKYSVSAIKRAVYFSASKHKLYQRKAVKKMRKSSSIKHCVTLAAVFVFVLSFGAFAETTSLIPYGKTVGVKIYTDGLLVVGTSEVNDFSGKTHSPAADCGIKINDIILKADNIELKTAEQLSQIISAHNESIKLTIKRGEEVFDVCAEPCMDKDGKTRLGLWLRDSTAGIGTVTYINPNDLTFAALGHGICDIDTGNILSVKSGNILNCNFLSVIKSKKGAPGEISGSFGNETIGNITKNTPHGIFGKADKLSGSVKAIPVAEQDEVRTGIAYILSDFDDGDVKKYEIELTKLSKNSNDKAIVFKVTDKDLIEKTGGIVQGMSGSPIVQNEKLAGAVTHVFVNEPTKGYGIFIKTTLAAE